LRKALTIAGSDTSGGAGIQADLKTFQELGVYGMSALNVIVTMDPNGWSHQVFPLDLELLERQLITAFEGVGVDAVKTGMLASAAVVELVAHKLDQYGAERVVIDPVMVCKGTDEVLMPDHAAAIRELLVPRALVVTPNLFEAAQLAQRPPIRTLDDMREAAVRIAEAGAKNVLIKGGSKLEGVDKAVDLFYDGKEFTLLESEKFTHGYNHGAGCTTAAAITAELAKGASVPDAVRTAKRFVSAAIRHGFRLNQYVGSVMYGALRFYGDE